MLGGQRTRELKEPADHLLDLILRRPAIADHRYLNRRRRIFKNRDLPEFRRQQGDPSGLAELESRFEVLREESIFDCERRRELFLNDPQEVVEKMFESFLKGMLWNRPDLAQSLQDQTACGGFFQDCISCHTHSRIDS